MASQTSEIKKRRHDAEQCLIFGRAYSRSAHQGAGQKHQIRNQRSPESRSMTFASWLA
jgi:hypothetical protein